LVTNKNSYYYIVIGNLLAKITNTWRGAIICKIKSEYDCNLKGTVHFLRFQNNNLKFK